MNGIGDVRDYYRRVLPYDPEVLESRGDLKFWESIAARWGSQSILELGCGSGRVTTAIARHAPLWAADLLVEQLVRAREVAPRAHFVAADLRRLALRKAFDLVVLADDPMAHLLSDGDRQRALLGIAHHLVAGGRVVLEGLWRPHRQIVRVTPRAIAPGGRPPFTVEEVWTPEGDGSQWRACYRYTDGVSVTEACISLRSWTLEEIGGFGAAGLEVEAVWGDFDETPLGERSPRIVVVARRVEAERARR